MSINQIIPKENERLKDDNQLWYFTKDQKSKILQYLETCSVEDLKDISPMGENYFIPTWYYFLNDYDIAKKMSEKELFKDLINLSEKDYKIPDRNEEENQMFGRFKKVITNLNTTIYFTPNTEVLLLLKKAGFQFKNNSFAIDNFYKTYEIIKAGVIDFDEDYLTKNIYSVGDNFDSILQKILWNYEIKKDSKSDLLEMAMTINGFVELGCRTEIRYKKLITASETFVSEKKNYKELIETYCPDLHVFMQRLDFIEKMNGLEKNKATKNTKNKI